MDRCLPPVGSEAFGKEDEQILRCLVPHLQRALRIRWQLCQRDAARRLSETALDHIAQGIALMDEKGKVLFANLWSESMFRHGEGPLAVNGHFTASNPHDANRIKEALRSACLGVSSSLRLKEADHGRQWVVIFSPVRTPPQDLTEGARILVLFSEPTRPATEGIPAFAELYCMTPTETRVLEQLLLRENTQDICDVLQVGITMLRTHLSRLFAKTGTSSQRDLVRFYLAHPFAATQAATAD